MISVITYTDFLTNEVQEKIQFILNIAQQDPNNRMPGNYSKEKIALNHTLAVSIAERDSVPFSYSSLMHRPNYKESARVISRFYYHPLHKIRGLKNAEMPSIKHIWRDHTISMIEQQTELAYEMGFNGVFISQHDKSLKFFTRMYDGLLVKSKFKDWKFEPGKLYRVCNGEDCEHMIIHRGNFYLEEV